MIVLGRMLRLIGPFRWWIAAGALLGFVAVGSNIALMATSAYLISKAAIVTNVADLALAITAVRVLAISRAAFRYLERYTSHTATFRILTHLRVWFYRSIEPLAPARIASFRSGDLLARIVADIDTLEDFYVRVVVPPIVAALVTAFACLLLGAFDALLGIALAAFLVLTGVVLPLASRRLSRMPASALAKTRGDLNALLVDEVQGMADLVALDESARHRARLLSVGRELDRLQDRVALVRGGSGAMALLFASLAGITVLGIAVPLVTGGRLDGVYLALLPLAAIASFEAIQPLSQSLQLLDSNEAAGRRLFELIDTTPEVVDPREPASAPEDAAIEIRGLRFAYAVDEPVVLDGLDLSIPSGGSVAIVGPSGSGKSTLVNLLLRFWDYRQGQIRIGGHDLHEYRVDDVRRMLGVASQQTHLFNATIRDNLAVADPDVTDDQISTACRLVQLDEFIATLPDGYDTRIGENGLLLSGGERQRLAIARAIIKGAPILILDEATAHLDVLTEDRLMASLQPFVAGRTTILISHRAAIARWADRVVTLREGRTAAA